MLAAAESFAEQRQDPAPLVGRRAGVVRQRHGRRVERGAEQQPRQGGGVGGGGGGVGHGSEPKDQRGWAPPEAARTAGHQRHAPLLQHLHQLIERNRRRRTAHGRHLHAAHLGLGAALVRRRRRALVETLQRLGQVRAAEAADPGGVGAPEVGGLVAGHAGGVPFVGGQRSRRQCAVGRVIDEFVGQRGIVECHQLSAPRMPPTTAPPAAP